MIKLIGRSTQTAIWEGPSSVVDKSLGRAEYRRTKQMVNIGQQVLLELLDSDSIAKESFVFSSSNQERYYSNFARTDFDLHI